MSKKYKVIKPFIDKYDKKVKNIGDYYKGNKNRINSLIKKGYVEEVKADEESKDKWFSW